MDIIGMEEQIRQVKSVLSCKILLDDKQNISEIHVVSKLDRSPKQISRDIQSVIAAWYSIEIDHRKISIAQIGEDLLSGQDLRLKIRSMDFSILETRVEVKVLLEKNDEIFEGTVSGANTYNNTQRLLAIATLNAVEKYCNTDNLIVLEDIKTMHLAAQETVVTAVTLLDRWNETMVCGCAFVSRDKKEAVVKSTLDAVNRMVFKLRQYSGRLENK